MQNRRNVTNVVELITWGSVQLLEQPATIAGRKTTGYKSVERDS